MNAEEQCADSPNQPKPSLSRCAACYNQRAGSMPHRGGGGDSSSSEGDSGPDVGWESEAESSSSSSCCSAEDLSEEPEEPETQTTSPTAEAKSESGGRDEGEEASESQEDKSRTKAATRRPPLVKSHTLPSSFAPHLAPLTLLPRPHTVVSTLRLQVVPQKHDDDNPLFVENRDERVNDLLHPPTGLPWQPFTFQQRQLSHYRQPQHPQHPQPQHYPPLSAQGQRLPPPPPHTLPVPQLPMLHTHPQAPHTHLHTLADPHLCWYCYNMQFPYSHPWSLYGGGHLPR